MWWQASKLGFKRPSKTWKRLLCTIYTYIYNYIELSMYLRWYIYIYGIYMIYLYIYPIYIICYPALSISLSSPYPYRIYTYLTTWVVPNPNDPWMGKHAFCLCFRCFRSPEWWSNHPKGLLSCWWNYYLSARTLIMLHYMKQPPKVQRKPHNYIITAKTMVDYFAIFLFWLL